MNTGNWKIIFHSVLRKDLIVYAFVSRETTSAVRRQEKSYCCEFL